jgi:hypothetical protein
MITPPPLSGGPRSTVDVLVPGLYLEPAGIAWRFEQPLD